MEHDLQQERSLILRLLQRKLGDLNLSIELQICQLSPADLEELAEALLDFYAIADLRTWLETHVA
jgi:hypothetical protein